MEIVPHDFFPDALLLETIDKTTIAEQIAQKVAVMVPRYRTAKAARRGDKCICPSCGKDFIKKSYQQAFCSNRGRQNCKDYYWNRANEQRALRAQLKNGAIFF